MFAQRERSVDVVPIRLLALARPLLARDLSMAVKWGIRPFPIATIGQRGNCICHNGGRIPHKI